MVFGFNFGRPKDWQGLELWAIYLIWIVVIIFKFKILLFKQREGF